MKKYIIIMLISILCVRNELNNYLQIKISQFKSNNFNFKFLQSTKLTFNKKQIKGLFDTLSDFNKKATSKSIKDATNRLEIHNKSNMSKLKMKQVVIITSQNPRSLHKAQNILTIHF